MRRLLCFVLALTLLPALALAQGVPDLSLLVYETPERMAPMEATGAARARIIPIDLWLDGTENMGGINGIEGTIYQGAEESIYSGGFHYLQSYGWGGKELHGWYLDILTALPTLLGDGQATWRVMRYGDEKISDELLGEFGLDPARGASLRRDLMTYANGVDAQLFREMVQPTAANFYGLGTEGMERIGMLDDVENADCREALAAAQAALLARAREGSAGAVMDREAGESHFLQALESMDTTRLNVLTLDTWSLGNDQAARGDTLTSVYQETLEALDLFAGQGLAVTFFALRLDYVGSITSYGMLRPQEAMHWGRLLQAENGRYKECAMPRDMLMILIGREDEVDEVAGRLERFLQTDETLNDAQGRGFHPGDGAVVAVNYFYDDELYERTNFTFAYDRGDLRPEQVTAATEADAAVLLSGGTEWVVHPKADGGYSDQQLTITAPLTEAMRALGVTAESLIGTAELADSLVLTQTAANAPETVAALREEAGVQVIPLRDRLYIFRAAEALDMQLSARVESDQLTVTVTLPGAQLAPGYWTLHVSCRQPDGAAALPAAFPFADEAWNYETGERMPTQWLDMPARIAASADDVRRRLQSGLRHAWCVGNERTTLGQTPNIPPVFRLLNAERLTDAFRQAAVQGEKLILDVQVTIRVDNR